MLLILKKIAFLVSRGGLWGIFFTVHPAVVYALEFNATDVAIGPAGGTYSRIYSMDNVPYIYDTGHTIGISDNKKFNYKYTVQCGGLDAKVDLPVIGSINGQDIYKITDNIGLVVWAGDTRFNSAHPMKGNDWSNVFDKWCSAAAQGYSFYVKPVILKRSMENTYNIPSMAVGKVRWRQMGNKPFTGKTEFTVTVNNFVINNGARSCRLQTPSAINLALPAVSPASFSQQGSEVFAGFTRIALQCDPGVTVWATLTDASDAANRTDRLTLTKSSTARGVGLKVYKNDESSALRFGPDSPVKNTENQWQLSAGTERNPSVNLKAKYVNIDGNITPGTVNGIATFTFSYQ